MRLDEQVTVTCTDTAKAMLGTVVRLKGNWVDVSVGDLLISLNIKRRYFNHHPRAYVGLHSTQARVNSPCGDDE